MMTNLMRIKNTSKIWLPWVFFISLYSNAIMADSSKSPSFGDVAGDVNIHYGNDKKLLNRLVETSWKPKLDEMTYEEQQVAQRVLGMMSPKEIDHAERYLSNFNTSTKEAREFKNRYITSIHMDNKRYKKALESVLDRYKGLPLNDVRFRYDLAYIIYYMRVDKGLEYAEDLISDLKERYRKRPDLSYVWMGINPRPLLRIFERDLYPYQDMHPKQQQILRYVLEKYPRDRFVDHALYLLHEYDEIIKGYPYSILREEAYYAKAYRDFYLNVKYRKNEKIDLKLQENLQNSILEALDKYYTYLKNYKNGNYVTVALENMSRAISQLNKEDVIIRELNKLHLVVNNLKKTWRSDNFKVIDERFVSSAAQEYLAQSKVENLDKWLNQLPVKIHQLIDQNYIYIRWARREFNAGRYIYSAEYYRKVLGNKKNSYFYNGEKLRVRMLGKLVQLSIERANNNINEERYLFEMAMTFKKTKYDADKAIPLLDNYKDKFAKNDPARIEMLKAFCYRDVSKGEAMLKSFWKVVNEYPNHHLADDALTEIAVYYLLWQRDSSKARKFLNRVIDRYPSGNAVDNALNWKAWSYINESKYQQALSAYMELVKKEPMSRFVKYAFNNIVKASSIEEKGVDPLLEYFNFTGKSEDAGFATFNGSPVVFYGSRDGRIKRLDVKFEWTTKISDFSFSPESEFVVFKAEDYKYKVHYAWRISDDSLFFVALNKNTKKKNWSKNFKYLEDKKVLKQLSMDIY